MTTQLENATCPSCGYKPGPSPLVKCPECGSDLQLGYLSPWGQSGRRWVGALIWCGLAYAAVQMIEVSMLAWDTFGMINDAQITMSPVSPTPLASGWALFIRPWEWLPSFHFSLLALRLGIFAAAAILRWRFARTRSDAANALAIQRWTLWLLIAFVAVRAIELPIGYLA